MILQLLDELSRKAVESPAEFDIPLKKPFSILQAGGSRARDRKVNFLIFNCSQPHPLMIIKAARTEIHQERLRREYESLQQISRMETIKDTVPKPIGMYEVESHLVTVETFVPGTPLSILLRRRDRIKEEQVRTDLQMVQNWMQLLQRASQTEAVSTVGRLALQYDLESCGIRLPKQFIDEITSLASIFHGFSFTLTGSHGDLWPGNYLVQDKGVGIIDWESYCSRAVPFIDAFLFITTYGRHYPWGGWKWTSRAESFENTFFRENWFSEIVCQYFREVLSQYFLPQESSHFLYSIFLLNRAVEERRAGIVDGQWMNYLQEYAAQSKQSVLRKL